jgi:exopolyphosphatase/guanosine-5'-triphosphate,3'-diphosphate pyrophosphatase
MRVAAIDCGTNSIRLLIADVNQDNQRLVDIERKMEIVRLGEGVDRTGEFSQAALERTFAALDTYQALIQRSDAEKVAMVATSATRDAANRDVFVAGVEARLGVKPRVISGQEEASLSFDGATRSLRVSHPSPFLVIDLGGGSTELVVGDNGVGSAYSMDVGCVRMSERHLTSDPPTQLEIAGLRRDVRSALATAAQHVDWVNAKTMVGVAGTVTTVAAMYLKLTRYDPKLLHGAVIPAHGVAQVAKELSGMSRVDIATLPFMHPGRVDVITAGALVLDEVVATVGLPELVASELDILDGIAWSIAT